MRSAPMTMACQLRCDKSKEADDKEGGEEAELRMPRSFDFEDERKPFILMEKVKFFVHEEVEYFKKGAVRERTDSHSWVEQILTRSRATYRSCSKNVRPD